jgi:hypothetical protein
MKPQTDAFAAQVRYTPLETSVINLCVLKKNYSTAEKYNHPRLPHASPTTLAFSLQFAVISSVS